MTEAELQAVIHTLYEGDTDTPDSTDDDYLARRNLINAAINRWEHYEGTDWNELRIVNTSGDGDETTTADTYTYDCPTDFKSPGSFVRLYTTAGASTYYQVVPYDKIQLYDNTDTNICYFVGNPQDGYDLKFLDTQDAGQNISYEYYKTAETIDATTDVPEMSDPYFIVYFVVARLFQQDNRPQMAREYSTEAEARLQQMKVRNDMLPAWNQEPVLDKDFSEGLGGFGT